MATSDPITKILLHQQIARYISGKVLCYGRIILNCLKLRAIQSWRGHQPPPPPPPQGGIGLKSNDFSMTKKCCKPSLFGHGHLFAQ